MSHPRPTCSAADAKSVGYTLMPCSNPAVALYRAAGGHEQVLCLECLMRQIRVAIDLHGHVLHVISQPEPAAEDSGEAPPPAPSEAPPPAPSGGGPLNPDTYTPLPAHLTGGVPEPTPDK